MIFYIKDKKDFSTKAMLESTDYKLVDGSIYGDLTQIKTVSNPNVIAGDIIFSNRFIGVISSVNRSDEVMNLSVAKMDSIFDRDILFDNVAITTDIESYLKYELEKNFISLEDNFYSYPFLVILKDSSTEYDSLPAVENGLVNYKQYLAKVQRLYGIYIKWKVVGNQLRATITKKNNKKNLIFGGMPYVITEETFSESNVAKITVYNEELSFAQDYYYLSDGTFTINPNDSKRVEGEWRMMSVSENDDIYEKVRNEFLSNEYSHKISFKCTEEYARFDYYDYLNIMLNKKRYDSYISKKIINSDGSIEYSCGELKTTLTEKLGGI